MGVSSLPKTVTGQRRDFDLNLGPSEPESSTLTTWLPSHEVFYIRAKSCRYHAPVFCSLKELKYLANSVQICTITVLCF